METLERFWLDNPQLAARKKKVPAVYTITYSPIGAGLAGIQAPPLTVAQDFVCTRITGVQTTTVTNAAYIVLPLLLQIVISSMSFNFNSQKTEWSTSGIGVSPQGGNEQSVLPYPIFVASQGTITTTLDNPGAAAANVWISFIGVQVNP